MIELRDGASVDHDELTDYLRSHLARYEIPTAMAVVEHIPRTPSGKAELTAVRQYFAAFPHGEHG